MGDTCHPYWPLGIWVPLPCFGESSSHPKKRGNAKSPFAASLRVRVRFGPGWAQPIGCTRSICGSKAMGWTSRCLAGSVLGCQLWDGGGGPPQLLEVAGSTEQGPGSSSLLLILWTSQYVSNKCSFYLNYPGFVSSAYNSPC